jgi:hypothetical protein
MQVSTHRIQHLQILCSAAQQAPTKKKRKQGCSIHDVPIALTAGHGVATQVHAPLPVQATNGARAAVAPAQASSQGLARA